MRSHTRDPLATCVTTSTSSSTGRSHSMSRRRASYLPLLSLLLAVGACAGGVDTSVTIKRDTYGVPHVFADDVYRLFYGYGYVVAEDRLFQMEMSRRSVMGTVSEVLGAEYVEIDTRSRTVSDTRSITEQLAALPPADRDIFEGYATGFNARVREVLADRVTLQDRRHTRLRLAGTLRHRRDRARRVSD